MTTPVLAAISHGTSSAAGQTAVTALADAIREDAAACRSDRGAPPRMSARSVEDAATLRSGAARGCRTQDVDDAPEVVLGHVDVQQPDVPAVLSACEPGASVVIVPLLLSAGYHVHVDLREAVAAASDRTVTIASALGPDPRLADVLARRLLEAGARPGRDHIVMAAAGSSDAGAVDDCRAMGRLLAERLGVPVTVGFLSAAAPKLADAVATTRGDRGDGPRVVVASYLLAPGFFHDLARAAGADVVTEPLLDPQREVPDELVAIVRDRYDLACTRLSTLR